LNFDIIKFCTEYAIKKNKIAQKDLQFSLVSNFVNMTDEIFEFCFKNNIGLCTSIDGPKELHNKNRQEYDKTIKWVEKIQNKFREENIKDTNKSYKLNSLITVSKESLKYPKEIVDTYIKYGLESLFAKSLNPLGFAKDNENIYYSAEEYLEFWEKYVDYIIEKSSQGYNISEYYVKTLLMKLEGIIDPNYTDLMSPCGAVRSQMLYNYNGEVFSCDEGRMTKDDIFKIGNVKTDNYIKLTTNPTACSIITSSINDTQICDKCVFKPFCGICPVLNYSAENSVIANIHKNNRCKILKAQFKYILNILENEKNKSEIIKSWIN